MGRTCTPTMRLSLLLWLAILAVSNSLDGDSGVASVSTSSTVVDKSLGKDCPAEDLESNLSLAAAVPNKVGETESDSAECIDALKVSSFACKSGQNQMCEVTQKASSDICNTKAKQASSREKESGDVVMNAKEDAIHLNQKALEHHVLGTDADTGDGNDAASASVLSQQRSPATLNLLGEAPHGLLDNLKLLKKTQAQCPQSSLVCPGATGQPLSKETQEPLTSVSPKNEPGCIPHPGLATQSWFAPYRGMDLPAELRNIKYRNATVDCNPASCDNPPQCGIPQCKAFDKHAMNTQYDKAVYLPGAPSALALRIPGCPAQGSEGCRITGEILTDQAINKDSHWQGFMMRHPATRFGYTLEAAYPAGFIQCSPAVVEKDSDGATGSWLAAGAKNCNPDNLKVCTKISVAHTGLPPQTNNMHRRAVAVFYKTVWCIGPKCYVSKGGNCLRLKKLIMPKYASASNKHHSKRALRELKAGRYDNGCSAAARKAAADVIASN